MNASIKLSSFDCIKLPDVNEMFPPVAEIELQAAPPGAGPSVVPAIDIVELVAVVLAAVC